MSAAEQAIDRAGYIYILAAEGSPYYKIGRAKVVNNRIAQMRPNLPFKVRRVCTLRTDDAIGLERWIHQRFKDLRQNGEWFALTPEQVESLRREWLWLEAWNTYQRLLVEYHPGDIGE